MRVLVAALLLGGLIGCGPPAPPGPRLVKTRGQLLSGTRPAAGAVLVFHPAAADGKLPPRARAGADGTFDVATADGGDGLPEGDYAVTVEWRSGTGENGDDGKSLAAERYAKPGTTPLKAAVRPGPGGVCVLPTYTLTN